MTTRPEFPPDCTLRVTVSTGVLQRVYGLAPAAADRVADTVINAVSDLAAVYGCTVAATTIAADEPPIPRLRNIAMDVSVSIPGGLNDDPRDLYGLNEASARLGEMRSALADVARSALRVSLAAHGIQVA